MPQQSSCSQCDVAINLPDGAVGKKVQCPSCGAVNRIYGGAGGGYRLGAEEGEVATLMDDNAPVRVQSPRQSSRGRAPDNGGMILAMGILGLVFCQICGIVAWVMGNSHIATCKSRGVEPDGMATAGRILGIISVVMLVFILLIFLAMIPFSMMGTRY